MNKAASFSDAGFAWRRRNLASLNLVVRTHATCLLAAADWFFYGVITGQMRNRAVLSAVIEQDRYQP